MNKKIFAALLLAALLAPSFAAAASIDARVIGTSRGRAAAAKILAYEAAGGAEANVRWQAGGAAAEELVLSCKGGERLRVEVGEGLSYVPCDGKLHAAYRGSFARGVDEVAKLSVTGDRAVKVSALFKLYRDVDGSRGALIVKDKLAVKVLPKKAD